MSPCDVGQLRALVAPDSFKGTFSATDVAEAMASGFSSDAWQVDRCPLGDGGEGTAEALLAQRDGQWVSAHARDPLGREIEARFALFRDPPMALVEAAAASGLPLVNEEDRDAEAASTYGTGELMVAAAELAPIVMVAVGGTATTDGGAGAIEAIERGGGVPGRVVCLCDVRTPWERSASVFAPQKGAQAAEVARLEARLDALAERLPRDPRGVPRTGAGGGLSGGLWAAFDAELVSGAEWLLEAIGFDRRARASTIVATGEGRLDHTTSEGKVVAEVAQRARRANRPLHAVVGQDASTAELRAELGLSSVTQATTPGEIEAACRLLVGTVRT